MAAQPETADDSSRAAVRERLRRAITRRRKALVFLDAATPPPSPGPPPSPPPPSPAAPGNKRQRGAGLPPGLPPLDHASPAPSASKQSPPPTSPSSATATTTPPPGDPPSDFYEGGLFCSELVAALYQRLGLLDAPFPARYDYVPADFAQSLGDPLGVDCLGPAIEEVGGQGYADGTAVRVRVRKTSCLRVTC